MEEKWNPLANSAEPAVNKVQAHKGSPFWTVAQDSLFCGLELMIQLVFRSFFNNIFS